MTIRSSILMGGMAAAVALTAAGGAFAAGPTPLYGGGSTLVEKVYRDLFNTYGASASGDLCSGRTLCPRAAQEYNSAVELLYVGVGSGNGLKALDGYDPSQFISGAKVADKVPTPSGRDFGAFYGTGTGTAWVPDGASTKFYPSVSFAGSDNTLSQTDVDSVKALGFGPVIQLPGLTAAIAVPFKPTAGWNPHGVTVRGNKAKVQLSTNTICGIFTGAIKVWSDPAITKDNGGVKLGTGTIKVVYRNDSIGTTFIFTNALLNQCGTTAHPTKSTHKIPDQWLADNSITPAAKAPFYHSGTSFFINVFKANHLPANFYNDNGGASGVTGGASGSGGLQKIINATAGSIGYISPDFVQPVDPNGPQAANVQTYATFNGGKTPVYVAPTAGNAQAAMATAAPPTFSKANPLNWGAVQPTPTAASAYPFSGFSFIDLYTCYKSQATVNALVATTGKHGFLTWYYGASSVNAGKPASLLASAGFAPIPTAWSKLATTLLTSATLGPNVPGKGACAKIAKGA